MTRHGATTTDVDVPCCLSGCIPIRTREQCCYFRIEGKRFAHEILRLKQEAEREQRAANAAWDRGDTPDLLGRFERQEETVQSDSSRAGCAIKHLRTIPDAACATDAASAKRVHCPLR